MGSSAEAIEMLDHGGNRREGEHVQPRLNCVGPLSINLCGLYSSAMSQQGAGTSELPVPALPASL